MHSLTIAGMSHFVLLSMNPGIGIILLPACTTVASCSVPGSLVWGSSSSTNGQIRIRSSTPAQLEIKSGLHRGSDHGNDTRDDVGQCRNQQREEKKETHEVTFHSACGPYKHIEKSRNRPKAGDDAGVVVVEYFSIKGAFGRASECE